MGVSRLEVRSKFRGNHPLRPKLSQSLGKELEGFEEIKVYLVDDPLDKCSSQKWREDHFRETFSDPLLDNYHAQDYDIGDYDFFVEVGFHPGVTDNHGNSATEALGLVDSAAKKYDVKVYTSKLYALKGVEDKKKLEALAKDVLYNPLLQSAKVVAKNDSSFKNRFLNNDVPVAKIKSGKDIKEINLDVSPEALKRLANKNCWALTLDDLEAISEYFGQSADLRAADQMPISPTDVEMEIIAQTWSEHCKHRIFNATIDYSDYKGEHFVVDGLYKSFIKKSTEVVTQKSSKKWCISVFNDNAGIVRFDKNIDVAIKVETHNSPSALDPYGGALTGILGVNRDILGVGLGARPIANTNVFCVGPFNWPDEKDKGHLLEGLKRPKEILQGIHKGVEDGGNKSGIPTVNGAIIFDKDYVGKPLVYCGTVGVLPQKLKCGASTSHKAIRVGDLIVMAGGKIGKDGIHGATFSSMPLTEGMPSSVVQIGDPLTQKRLLDFTIAARDQYLFSGVTDNGAGGLSSSVGEMAQFTNGAVIDVGKAPTKYPGLKSFELMVSESQERMTFAVPPEKIKDFLELAKNHGVLATTLGVFNDSGHLEVFRDGKLVAKLALDFLHDGVPQLILRANYEGPKARQYWSEALPKRYKWDQNWVPNLAEITKALLGSANVASKERWVRRYDHEVQAATLVKPFCGPKQCGPNDAGVVWLAPHGGESKNAVSVSCGINPKLSRLDPYVMAACSIDEAVRNCVAVGTDPNAIALVDNFCWPDPIESDNNPDGAHKLGQLVRTVKGLYDTAVSYGMPFVSGKDSMKNDYVGKNSFGQEVKISVPPTLLVTALGRVPNIDNIVTSDFKAPDQVIAVVGPLLGHRGGSELCEVFEVDDQWDGELPNLKLAKNIKLYKGVFKAIKRNLLSSCHDISDGGALCSVIESAIGGQCGALIDFALKDEDELARVLFGEGPARFIVSYAKECEQELTQLLKEQVTPIGRTWADKTIKISWNDSTLLNLGVAELKKCWRESHGV